MIHRTFRSLLMIAAVSLLTQQFIWGMARHGRVHLSIIVSSHDELLGGVSHDTNRHISQNNGTIQIEHYSGK